MILKRGRFGAALEARAASAGVAIDSKQERALEAYFALLTRWNRRINLTALPLDPPTDVAIDRLFIEPLVAAEALGTNYRDWIDLGSGGGSPAIPMKTRWPGTRLTMVESKSRKASFLREAIREMPLLETSVAESRFERLRGMAVTADLVTVRAVKPDFSLIATAYSLLRVGGTFAMFCAAGSEFAEREHPAFSGPAAHSLPGQSSLAVWQKRNL